MTVAADIVLITDLVHRLAILADQGEVDDYTDRFARVDGAWLLAERTVAIG